MFLSAEIICSELLGFAYFLGRNVALLLDNLKNLKFLHISRNQTEAVVC
jgi:hypothetical protein